MSESSSRSRVRSRILLMGGSVLFSLFLAEITVRIVNPMHRLEYTPDDDVYWRFEVNQHDPGPPTETINAQGFRGTRDVDPKGDRPRIFVLGDSYTWGSGVSDHETMPAQLETLSGEALDVVNGAMPGWGIFQMEIRLTRWIQEVDPDVVVTVFPVGDVYRQPYADEGTKNAYLRQAKLRTRLRKFSRLSVVVARAIESLQLRSSRRQVKNAAPAPTKDEEVPTPTFLRCWKRDQERLRNMQRLAAAQGAPFLIMVWPQKGPTSPWFMEEIARFSAELGVPHIDLAAALLDEDFDEYTLPGDHHPSGYGQGIAASVLYPFVQAALQSETPPETSSSGE